MILDPRFLEKPAFAVEQSRNAAIKMAQESQLALCTALKLVERYTQEDAKYVENMESKVDRYEDELGTYLVRLSHKDISETDSHDLSIMLHCIGDFERISDHAVNLMESAAELHKKGLNFSKDAKADMKVLGRAVLDIVQLAYRVFEERNVALAQKIEPLEEVIDELSKEVKRRHVQRLRNGECTIEMGFILSDIVTSLERVADHCSNIGVCVTQVSEDLYDTHSHLNLVKNGPDASFYEQLEEAREKYLLS